MEHSQILKWFEDKTALKGGSLEEHMKIIDKKLIVLNEIKSCIRSEMEDQDDRLYKNEVAQLEYRIGRLNEKIKKA